MEHWRVLVGLGADSRVSGVGGNGFATEVEVRFAETDMQGVAHHSVYLVWFEMARIDYLSQFDGGYPALREQGVDATTPEAYVRYLAPARFGDRLLVRARCTEIRGARFRFEYSVERHGERLAEGWTDHACIDAGTLRPTRVPAWLKAAIEATEG